MQCASKMEKEKEKPFLCADPCPPDSLAQAETSPGNCTLTWNSVLYADSYEAFIKRSDGSEIICNTTGNECSYSCECGYTHLMSVFALNQAGRSSEGTVLNRTTCEWETRRRTVA